MTMTDQQQLEALLATHADVLRDLLPAHINPAQPFEVKHFGPLTKYTLGEMPDGRWAHLHHLAQADSGLPHCHPCEMESHLIQGGYYERRFHLEEDGTAVPYRVTLRMAGESNFIAADCIHAIIELLPGPCWSLAFTGPVVREWRHYPIVTQAA